MFLSHSENRRIQEVQSAEHGAEVMLGGGCLPQYDGTRIKQGDGYGSSTWPRVKRAKENVKRFG